MSEVNFKSLQLLHESLLQKQQNITEENQQGFTKGVREYIDQAKRAGSNIASTRERDQVRANLRYWANYLYSIDKTFPDTELAPSTVEEKRPVSTIITFIVFIILIVFGGIQSYRSVVNRSTVTPLIPVSGETETATALVADIPTTISVTDLPTPESTGFNVTLSSPANGDSITPNLEFSGTFENLKPGWAIHALFIREDKYFPIKENYLIPDKPLSNEWTIQTQLTESPDEMSKAQSYSVFLVASINDSTRELLSNSSESGIEIKSLPDTVLPFDNTARVIYRDPFKMVQETRLVYSMSLNETSYDLYTSRPDGSDVTQITITPNVSEIFPNLSPDGTKIVYVKRFRETSSSPHMYAISIMDANGENDHEITDWTPNVLETPQWSHDSLYIAYAVGDISQSSSTASWNIQVYEFSTHDNTVLFAESERFDQRYFTWLPDTNDIIFGARPQTTGTVGFDLVHIDSSEETTFFFDTDQDDIRPGIKFFENGYLLTYTVVNPDKTHDIYAITDSDRQFPFDGSPIRLTFRRAGEMVDGVRIGSADYPIPDPASNSIYYIRNVNIYRLEFTMREGRMELNETKNNDSERYGDLVIETGLKDDIWGFDVGFMEAFFPIK